jgi:hypothetical protein
MRFDIKKIDMKENYVPKKYLELISKLPKNYSKRVYYALNSNLEDGKLNLPDDPKDMKYMDIVMLRRIGRKTADLLFKLSGAK